jgi:hypothetical protein
MRKLTSIITVILLILAIVSCDKKEKVDTKNAPKEVSIAFEKAYKLSQELTHLQLEAGANKILDAAEIDAIGEMYGKLAIINNINVQKYATDKYFIALRNEYKDKYDVLADTVAFLKDCEGYDQLGLAIQKISLEVRDVTTLQVEKVEVIENPKSTKPE